MVSRSKVKDLRKGDVLTPTGNEVLSVTAGISTPARCRDVVVKRPNGRVTHHVWKAETVITHLSRTSAFTPSELDRAIEPHVDNEGHEIR